MPSLHEMESALDEILDYSRTYRGRHDEAFAALRERLSEIDEAELSGPRVELVKAAYVDAVSMLLFLAEPPSRESCGRVLRELAHLTGMEINEVRILPEHRRFVADVEAPADSSQSYEYVDLCENMPAPRRVGKVGRSIIDHFAEEMQSLRQPEGTAE